MTTPAVWTLDELASRVAAALASAADAGDYPGAPNGRVRDVPDRRRDDQGNAPEEGGQPEDPHASSSASVETVLSTARGDRVRAPSSLCEARLRHGHATPITVRTRRVVVVGRIVGQRCRLRSNQRIAKKPQIGGR